MMVPFSTSIVPVPFKSAGALVLPTAATLSLPG